VVLPYLIEKKGGEGLYPTELRAAIDAKGREGPWVVTQSIFHTTLLNAHREKRRKEGREFLRWRAPGQGIGAKQEKWDGVRETQKKRNKGHAVMTTH